MAKRTPKLFGEDGGHHEHHDNGVISSGGSVDYVPGGEDAYHGDWGVGRIALEDGDVIFVGGGGGAQDASVDGQGGTIRNKSVFTIDQAAFYLNRGEGLKTFEGETYGSGANWGGAQGPGANGWYSLATSKTNGGEANDPATQSRLGQTITGPTGPLTQLNYGFYETKETLPDPYIYTNIADGTNAQYVGDARANGFSALSPAQRAAAREAFQSWDDLIGVQFVETHFSQGDINLMNTTTGPAQASAFLPYGQSTTAVITQDDGTRVTLYERYGDVFINPAPSTGNTTALDEGQYGLTTLVHEIGHSLGLQHPGNYNFGPNFTATYMNGAEYYQDSNMYTIMSYWDAEETGAHYVDWQYLNYNYAATPMVHDIAAIQRIYGADMTTRTGDTTYGFNASADTAGRDAYDFTKTPLPVMSIWDAGGTDTLDLSGFNTPSVIDLNPGAYSSAGGFLSANIPTLAEINARRAADGRAARSQATYDYYIATFGAGYLNGLMTDNIGIAYGVTVENAKGGAGDDQMLGNDVDNVLTGNGGKDSIRGGKGDDTLLGGAGDDNLAGGAGKDIVNGGEGFDTASFRDATGAITLTVNSSGIATVNGDGAGDTYISIEAYQGSAHGDTMTGTSAADILSGGDGNDKIAGGNGDDTLSGDGGNDELAGDGGHDTLNGGTGTDKLDGGTGNDKLAGGADVDNLLGSGGNDILDGGAGADNLNGGSGSDVFLLRSASDANGDKISDFQVGVDKIDLAGLFAGDGPVSINFTAPPLEGAANAIYVYSSGGTTFVVGDNNGGGGLDFSIALTNGAKLKTTDFITNSAQWNDHFTKIGSPTDYSAFHGDLMI